MDKKSSKTAIETRIYDSTKELADAVAGAFKADSMEARKKGKKFFVALSGGRTPRAVYERLAREPYRSEIPWADIHIFWGDERCVPRGHPDSNFNMARDSLLEQISIPQNNIHRMRGEERPDQEAERYSLEIINTVPDSDVGIPRFDWIFLGLGRDGHTASLFPGASSLEETERLCVSAVDPESGKKRLTLTLPVINNAGRVLFLVTGKDKADIVAEILTAEKGKKSYPASLVAPTAGLLELYLDDSAASSIKSS